MTKKARQQHGVVRQAELTMYTCPNEVVMVDNGHWISKCRKLLHMHTRTCMCGAFVTCVWPPYLSQHYRWDALPLCMQCEMQEFTIHGPSVPSAAVWGLSRMRSHISHDGGDIKERLRVMRSKISKRFTHLLFWHRRLHFSFTITQALCSAKGMHS